MVPERPHLGGGNGIDAGGRDSRPPTAETTPVQTEEEDSGEERWVSMVADMVWEDRQQESSTRAGFLPQQMAFFLNNILMFGINTNLGHIFTNLYPKEITCASSTVSTSGPAQGYLGIFRTSLGWVAVSFIPTDITCTFMVISWIP